MRSVLIKGAHSSGRLKIMALGFGQDESPFVRYAGDGFDLLLVCDYAAPGELPDLTSYHDISLVAWSLGVMAAPIVLPELNFARKTAINGTVYGIEEKLGVEPALYDLTIAGFANVRNYDKFIRRMCGMKAEVLADYKAQPVARSLKSLREELIYLKGLVPQRRPDFAYDRVLIGTRDVICYAENTQRAFAGKAAVELYDCAHYDPLFFKLAFDES